MIRRITKTGALLLALMFLLTAALSCNRRDNDREDSSTPTDIVTDAIDSGTDSGDSIRYDENGYQMDNLPDDLDFNGKDVRIFAHPQAYNEFEIEIDQINNSVLNNAVHRRNLKTEARTGTNLVFVMEQTSTDLTYTAQLENLQSGPDACTLFSSYSRDASGLMIKGYTADLSDMDYIDFSAPWWSQALVDKVSIYDQIYFCSGDISPMLFAQTFTVFYNKGMVEEYVNLEDYGAESLYEMVYDKTWTIDNMIKMCKGVGYNTDNTKDENDTYGFTVNVINQDGFYQAAGLNVLAYNDDGSVRVSDDMNSAKADSLVKKLVDFYNSPDAMCNEQYLDGSQLVPSAAWEKGNSMFYMGIVKHATNYQALGLDFGILPVPKWDVEQENYYSISGFAYAMWSMARTAKGEDAEASAAVLECLASESYRTVAPALYTTVLQEQTSNSAADYEMWNTIKASVTIEGGRCFDANLETLGWSIFRNAIMKRTGDYMSYYATYADKLAGNVASMNIIMATLDEIYGS